MGKAEDDIRRAIQQIGEKAAECFPATVTKNNPNDDFVEVQALDGTTYPDVRKRAAIDGKKGMIITPVQGSSVLVSRIQGSNSLYISMVSEIEKIKIDIENESITINKDNIHGEISDMKLDITKDGIKLNDGSFDGLVKAPELKDQLDKTNDLLSAIIQIISGPQIPEPGNGANSAFQTALNTAIAGKQLGDYSNIKNDKITHGT